MTTFPSLSLVEISAHSTVHHEVLDVGVDVLDVRPHAVALAVADVVVAEGEDAGLAEAAAEVLVEAEVLGEAVAEEGQGRGRRVGGEVPISGKGKFCLKVLGMKCINNI